MHNLGATFFSSLLVGLFVLLENGLITYDHFFLILSTYSLKAIPFDSARLAIDLLYRGHLSNVDRI